MTPERFYHAQSRTRSACPGCEVADVADHLAQAAQALEARVVVLETLVTPQCSTEPGPLPVRGGVARYAAGWPG